MTVRKGELMYPAAVSMSPQKRGSVERRPPVELTARKAVRVDADARDRDRDRDRDRGVGGVRKGGVEWMTKSADGVDSFDNDYGYQRQSFGNTLYIHPSIHPSYVPLHLIALSLNR